LPHFVLLGEGGVRELLDQILFGFVCLALDPIDIKHLKQIIDTRFAIGEELF
jgi:hypothetical protein